MESTLTTSPKFAIIAKNIGYIPAFIVGLGLNYDAFFILACLMCVDTVLGVIRSAILHGGASIRSTILGHGVISKALIFFIPIMLVYTGRGSNMNLVPVALGIVTMLVLSETYSILGHVQSIRQGEDVKEFDAISMLLTGVRKTIEKLLASSNK